MGDVLILPIAPRERLREVYRYGSAAGLDLVLMLDTDEGAHLPLRLITVAPDPIGAEVLASFHDTTGGRWQADKVAASVFLALRHAEWTIPGSAA